MSEGEDEMSDEAEIEVMEDVEHEPKAPAEREASHSEQAELGHRDYVKDIVVNLKSSEVRKSAVLCYFIHVGRISHINIILYLCSDDQTKYGQPT